MRCKVHDDRALTTILGLSRISTRTPNHEVSLHRMVWLSNRNPAQVKDGRQSPVVVPPVSILVSENGLTKFVGLVQYAWLPRMIVLGCCILHLQDAHDHRPDCMVSSSTTIQSTASPDNKVSCSTFGVAMMDDRL